MRKKGEDAKEHRDGAAAGTKEIIIVGGGLSGLSTAYYLTK